MKLRLYLNQHIRLGTSCNICCMFLMFCLCFFSPKLSIHFTILYTSFFPTPLQYFSCLQYPVFCLCTLLLNYIYSCMSRLIYSMNILIRPISLWSNEFIFMTMNAYLKMCNDGRVMSYYRRL